VKIFKKTIALAIVYPAYGIVTANNQIQRVRNWACSQWTESN